MINAVDAPPLLEFYMARHGETNAKDKEELIAGPGAVLTQNGIDQSLQLGELIKAIFPNPDAYHLAVSHLPRALHTAELAIGRLPEEDEIDEHLQEQDAGAHSGFLRMDDLEKMKRSPMGLLKLLLGRPELPSDFNNRIQGATHKHFEEAAEAEKILLCITHGGVIHQIAKNVGIDLKVRDVKNAGLYHFVLNSKG